MHHDLESLPCACTALRKASRAMSRLYDEALAPAGLTTCQYAILRHLARSGDLPLSRLAELLVMDRTSLYRAIAGTERAGWVRIDSAGHGRTRIAVLTGSGRVAMDAATPLWAAAQGRIVGAVGAAEWRALAGSLGELTAIAVRDAP